jgi:hypothetical protein
MSSISNTPFSPTYANNVNAKQSPPPSPQKSWTPSTEAVKEEFKNMDMNIKGMQIGALTGVVTGLLTGAVVFALNSKSITGIVAESMGHEMKSSRIGSAIQSAGEALFLGTVIGFTAGGELNDKVRHKVMQAAQLAHGEKPEKHWWNPFEKTPATKEEALNDLHEKELNKKSAFMTGAWHGFLDKTLGAGLLLACVPLYANLFGSESVQTKLIKKLAHHPTTWIKAVAIPIMGGVIGVQMIPILQKKMQALQNKPQE